MYGVHDIETTLLSQSEAEWYSKQEVNKCEPVVSKCACSEQFG